MDMLSEVAGKATVNERRNTTFPKATILLCVALVAAGLFCSILWRNGGEFAYTLDAPYTHMALAGHILQGTYGLNPGEPASPSSSILYPFLLAGLSLLPLGQFAPLIICLLATGGTALLMYAVAAEVGIEVGRLSTLQLAAVTLTTTLAFNLVGLAFAGLEHSLHVTVTLVSLLGMLRFIRRKQADWWWLGAIAIMPLLRFEAAAALLADLLVLLAFGKWKHALGIGIVGAAGIAGFGLFLHSLGLPWLPSSVLSRSEIASQGIGVGNHGTFGLVKAVYSTFRANIMAYGGTLIQLLIVFSLWGVARDAVLLRTGAGSWVKPAAVGFFIIIASAQLLGGSLSSFSRYEIYVLALGTCTLLVAWKSTINGWLRTITWQRCLGGCAATLLLFSGYVFRTADAVFAAGNVYDQPMQLHRFVTEFWRRPYASNHPGWINWDNPHYMLELSGLGSEEARLGRATPEHLVDLARSHDVDLAILYDNALPIPRSCPRAWCRRPSP
ncbi:MAG: hypothetical protein EOP02_03570 [Proteobacteria bacterium]|nr:MAG: hypothetical protein EOP02_03570 [Pseudomonadota bacterium]